MPKMVIRIEVECDTQSGLIACENNINEYIFDVCAQNVNKIEMRRDD